MARTRFTLDIGGEGRHRGAWNLNPRARKTIGPERGESIPRLIRGRADALPLADGSVDRIIMERAPLTILALREMARVISPGGAIILRHAVPPGFDPHGTAKRILPGLRRQRRITLRGVPLQQTVFKPTSR